MASKPTRASHDTVHVIVDTPQGSRNKYKYQEAQRRFILSHVLTAGAVFPFNFGYIPGTRAEDGDPVDVLVLMDAPVFVGCLIETRLIGVLEARQKEKGKKAFRNDRLIGVAVASPVHAALTDVQQLSPALRYQIQHFFVSYNIARDRQFTPLGWGGAARARALGKNGNGA